MLSTKFIGRATEASSPIELSCKRQVIGGLLRRRKYRPGVDERGDDRLRQQRLAVEQIVDELGLAIRIASYYDPAVTMRVIETRAEQRFDDIALRRHIEVAADDLAGRRDGFGPQRFDRLHDLPIAPLPLARRIRWVPFQVRVQDCQAP